MVCGGDREYVVPASSLCGLACHIMDGVLMVWERLELECRLCSRYLLLVLKFKMLICCSDARGLGLEPKDKLTATCEIQKPLIISPHVLALDQVNIRPLFEIDHA